MEFWIPTKENIENIGNYLLKEKGKEAVEHFGPNMFSASLHRCNDVVMNIIDWCLHHQMKKGKEWKKKIRKKKENSTNVEIACH